MSLSPIAVKDAPSQPVLQRHLPGPDSEIARHLGPALSQLTSIALGHGAAVGATFLRRLEAGAVAGLCARVEADVEGAERAELPAGKVACAVWTGDFSSRREGLSALEAAARAQGLTPTGAPWEVDLTGPHDVERPEDARTQLYLPVEGG